MSMFYIYLQDKIKEKINDWTLGGPHTYGTKPLTTDLMYYTSFSLGWGCRRSGQDLCLFTTPSLSTRIPPPLPVPRSETDPVRVSLLPLDSENLRTKTFLGSVLRFGTRSQPPYNHSYRRKVLVSSTRVWEPTSGPISVGPSRHRVPSFSTTNREHVVRTPLVKSHTSGESKEPTTPGPDPRTQRVHRCSPPFLLYGEQRRRVKNDTVNQRQLTSSLFF